MQIQNANSNFEFLSNISYNINNPKSNYNYSNSNEF